MLRRAVVFLAWTFGIGWGAAMLVRAILGPVPAAGPDSTSPSPVQSYHMIYAVLGLLFLVLPALITLGLSCRWRVSLNHYGLPGRSPGAALWLAPALTVGLTAISILLLILAGIGRFDASGMGEVQRRGEAGMFVEALELKLDLEEQRMPLLRRLTSGLTMGVTIGLLIALGTELGWRGLLVTELSRLGWAWAALASGLIGAVWWAPVLPATVASGETAWAGAVLRLASYALLGMVASWLRYVTGSILPAAALVATWATLGDVPLMAVVGGTYVQFEVSRLVAVLLLVLGLLVRSRLVLSQAGSANYT